MSQLISVNKISKTMGSKLLFENLSFGVSQNERLGLLGPNGAGKSTLLRILAGEEAVDDGLVFLSKGISCAYVKQEDTFKGDSNLIETCIERLTLKGWEYMEAHVQASIYLNIAGFEDNEQLTAELSGGWLKRLSLAIAFSQEPDLLILDEPTNHMDWSGILWLESYLKSYKKSFILVSHDRVLLDILCNKTMEINALYKDGSLSFDCGYKKFLERKNEYIQSQLKLQDSMSNKARREIEWLRAGVKARTTKSQSRINKSHELLNDLSEVKSRNISAQSRVRLDIDFAGKQSKKLIELKNLSISYGDSCLIKNLNFLFGPKTCIGILGSNGSGKTSLLKVIAGIAKNFTGEFFKADELKIVYFDQKRDDLPQNIDLVEYLGNGSEYTIFKNQSIHVASYASRFLFSSDKMKLKISQLSGGEQARLLIAKLLLQPADVLILDEPTNDLDIDSIEILEESLSFFTGLVILVSHDRFFMSELCHKFLALSGNGDWQIYAELEQWLKNKSKSDKDTQTVKTPKPIPKSPSKESANSIKKLTYKEKRQMETIEKDIEKAEAELSDLQSALESPENFKDPQKIKELLKILDEKREKVNQLYSLWERVEKKP